MYRSGAASPRRRGACGGPRTGHWRYCERCRRFVSFYGRMRSSHARAMREAWSAEEGAFLCHYTGARLDDVDRGSPWFMTFDHCVPGDDATLVVTAAWVNQMKTALSEEEFWKVIGEYDRYLREGGEFDKEIVKFEYWRRRNTRRRMGRE